MSHSIVCLAQILLQKTNLMKLVDHGSEVHFLFLRSLNTTWVRSWQSSGKQAFKQHLKQPLAQVDEQFILGGLQCLAERASEFPHPENCPSRK